VDVREGAFLLAGEMPEKIAAFAARTGQPQPRTPGEYVRACLESLALEYRRVLAQMEGILGRKFDVVHVVGGGGRNRLLCEMAAGAMGRDVLVGPYEATAAGNVLIQAMGLGRVRDLAEARRIMGRSFRPERFTPGAGPEKQRWDAASARYRELVGT